MKFIYYVSENNSIFEAIPEDGEKLLTGNRMEGNYPTIKLIDTKFKINYVSKTKLHPDIIAAICIFAFYPFIDKQITFPEAVSKNFSNCLKYDILPKYNKRIIVSDFDVTNIDEKLTSFKDLNYNNYSLAFGGGMDSSAIALILPDVPIIHLKVRNNDNEVEKFINNNLKNNKYIVSSNIRQLTKPNGFPLWASCFIGNLILACDLKTGKMITGTILGSSCLQNGKGYFTNCCKMTNRFDLFLRKLGVTPVYITGGCSEIITSKIIYDNNLSKSVLFCEKNNGRPCYKCTKCFRKMLELTYHGETFNFNTFDKKLIEDLLKTHYFQHIFIFLCQTYKGKNNIFNFIKNKIQHLLKKNTNFCTTVYTDFYDKYDSEVKKYILDILYKNNINKMSSNDIKYLKEFK